MRLLITGGCGFVGRQVARVATARGHQVVVADLQASNTSPSVRVDVTELEPLVEICSNQDVIVHCASVVGPIPARKDPIRAVDVNVRGTANVVEAARRHNSRVIYLSTATLYGTRPELAPLHESDIPDPVGHYDATKYAAEVVCQSYRKDFDLDVVSIRTGFVYGPGHSTGEYFVTSALNGESVHQEHGADQPCDFTYVKDLARGMVLAAEVDRLPDPVYNVTGGQLRTRGEFCEIVKRHLVDADISIGPGLNPAMHLRGPCVVEAARRDFGYQPEYTIEDGIGDWIRERQSVGRDNSQ